MKYNMAHINLKNDFPGIRGPMAYNPKTARPLNDLAEILLRDLDNSLSRGERELIGAYVSYLNDCFFCQNVHGAIAGHYLECDLRTMDDILRDFISSPISLKMKTLLAIAASVQLSGKHVTSDQIEAAKHAGASDQEIHDTVLIAAAFCMYNRYVDGLGTWAPHERQFYINRAAQRAEEGYLDFDITK